MVLAREIIRESDILNDAGKNLIGLKKVLTENKSNTLVRQGLLSSLKEGDYLKQVYEGLTLDSITEEAFSEIIMSIPLYTNAEAVEKASKKLLADLTKGLESMSLRHFQAEVSPENGGILVTKQLGVPKDVLQREFFITDAEAKDLFQSEFAKKYAELKLNALMRKINEGFEKADFRRRIEDVNIRIDKSGLYLNESQSIYNIDLLLFTIISKRYINMDSSDIAKLQKAIGHTLKFVEKAYQEVIM